MENSEGKNNPSGQSYHKLCLMYCEDKGYIPGTVREEFRQIWV